MLVETSGVKLARLLFFPRYKTGVRLQIKRVVKVVIHKAEKGNGTLTLIYDGKSEQYMLGKNRKLYSSDGQVISFEGVVYKLWHNEEGNSKTMEGAAK